MSQLNNYTNGEFTKFRLTTTNRNNELFSRQDAENSHVTLLTLHSNHFARRPIQRTTSDAVKYGPGNNGTSVNGAFALVHTAALNHRTAAGAGNSTVADLGSASNHALSSDGIPASLRVERSHLWPQSVVQNFPLHANGPASASIGAKQQQQFVGPLIIPVKYTHRGGVEGASSSHLYGKQPTGASVLQTNSFMKPQVAATALTPSGFGKSTSRDPAAAATSTFSTGRDKSMASMGPTPVSHRTLGAMASLPRTFNRLTYGARFDEASVQPSSSNHNSHVSTGHALRLGEFVVHDGTHSFVSPSTLHEYKSLSEQLPQQQQQQQQQSSVKTGQSSSSAIGAGSNGMIQSISADNLRRQRGDVHTQSRTPPIASAYAAVNSPSSSGPAKLLAMSSSSPLLVTAECCGSNDDVETANKLTDSNAVLGRPPTANGAASHGVHSATDTWTNPASKSSSSAMTSSSSGFVKPRCDSPFVRDELPSTPFLAVSQSPSNSILPRPSSSSGRFITRSAFRAPAVKSAGTDGLEPLQQQQQQQQQQQVQPSDNAPGQEKTKSDIAERLVATESLPNVRGAIGRVSPNEDKSAVRLGPRNERISSAAIQKANVYLIEGVGGKSTDDKKEAPDCWKSSRQLSSMLRRRCSSASIIPNVTASNLGGTESSVDVDECTTELDVTNELDAIDDDDDGLNDDDDGDDDDTYNSELEDNVDVSDTGDREVTPNPDVPVTSGKHSGGKITVAVRSAVVSSSTEGQPPAPATDSNEVTKTGRRTSASASVLSDCESQPALTASLFPNVPPTLNFVTDGYKVDQLPAAYRSLLKWRMSTITPNVVKQCIARSGFKSTHKSHTWIGYWGKHMKPPGFKAIREYQKVNHFPGSFQMGRKDRLWINLSKMQLRFGRKEYGFFPQTFLLPSDLALLRAVCEEGGSNQKWIIKPPASARGIGIHVVGKFSDIPKKRALVVQRYLSSPYLINDSKFDMRIYVYVTSYDPLRVYIYDNGLARFASVKYSQAARTLHNRYMHLTNYSVNKNNSEYQSNSNDAIRQGHKWTLKALWDYLKQKGVNTSSLWEEIKDIVIKTIVSSESYINSQVKANVRRRYCVHELFGFDILLDENLKPWVLEVNISPSLHSNSQLDISVKGAMIKDLLNLAGYMLPNKADMTSANTSSNESSEGQGQSSDGMCMDRRLWPAQLTSDERAKHAFYCQKHADSDVQDTILGVLTPDDLRILVETIDERQRRGNFICLFPTSNSRKYHRFFEQQRYYNLLVDAWVRKYPRSELRSVGVDLLRSYCAKGIHLQSSNTDPKHLWNSPTNGGLLPKEAKLTAQQR